MHFFLWFNDLFLGGSIYEPPGSLRVNGKYSILQRSVNEETGIPAVLECIDKDLHVNLTYKGCNPVGIYMVKVNNRNTRIRCEICLKLTIKTPERRR